MKNFYSALIIFLVASGFLFTACEKKKENPAPAGPAVTNTFSLGTTSYQATSRTESNYGSPYIYSAISNPGQGGQFKYSTNIYSAAKITASGTYPVAHFLNIGTEIPPGKVVIATLVNPSTFWASRDSGTVTITVVGPRKYFEFNNVMLVEEGTINTLPASASFSTPM